MKPKTQKREEAVRRHLNLYIRLSKTYAVRSGQSPFYAGWRSDKRREIQATLGKLPDSTSRHYVKVMDRIDRLFGVRA